MLMRAKLIATSVGLLFTLTACGGGSHPTATETPPPPLDRFDAILMGNAQDDNGHADLYGFTFHPLRAYRLTTGKNIDDFSVSGTTVLVAAADEQVDKLGQLGPGGQILPIPGIGRPHAFGPEIRPNGSIRYEDDKGSGKNDERFVEFNPRTGKTTVLYTGDGNEVGAFTTGPAGRLFYYNQGRTTHGQVVVIGPGKSTHTYRIATNIGTPAVGKRLIAVAVDAVDQLYTATGVVLLDPATGKQTPVDGWSPVAWSPDGTKLLVERTGAAAKAPSELGLLDPADPTHPRPIGTIPHLSIYQGSWLRGAPAQ